MANRRLKRMELPKECEDALEKAQIVEAKVSLACTVAANLSSLLVAHCCYVLRSLRHAALLPHSSLTNEFVEQDVLNKNKQELVNLLGLHQTVCTDLIARVAANICPIPRSVSDCIRAKRTKVCFLATGMVSLDATLRGGTCCSRALHYYFRGEQ